MTRRPWILAIVLVAGPMLGGCLGTAQATAMEEQPTAEDRAQQWAADAELVAIIGVEGTFPAYGGHADQEASYWSRAAEDDELGDGHCEIWAYRFVSEQRPDQVFTVVVDKDGEVIDTSTGDGGDDRPIGSYEIDSDEAAEIAFEANQGLAEGTSKEHYGLVLNLAQDDDHANPVWTIAGGGGDGTGGGGGVVVIDAATGEILSNHGGYSSGGTGR